MADVHATGHLLACFGMQSRESEGGALVVIDEQAGMRMQHAGWLAQAELLAQRAELLRDRIEMRRHKKRRRRPASGWFYCPPLGPEAPGYMMPISGKEPPNGWISAC